MRVVGGISIRPRATSNTASEHAYGLSLSSEFRGEHAPVRFTHQDEGVVHGAQGSFAIAPVPPLEHCGDHLAGAEAVVGRAAREAPDVESLVDRAAIAPVEMPARFARGLVEAKQRAAIEGEYYAAEANAARAVAAQGRVCHRDHRWQGMSAKTKTPPLSGRRFVFRFRQRSDVLGRPGSDLLSQALRLSTIGAKRFNGRVRDGIGFWASRNNHQIGEKHMGEFWLSRP